MEQGLLVVARAPQQRFEPRRQFAKHKWLDKIIVAANAQADNAHSAVARLAAGTLCCPEKVTTFLSVNRHAQHFASGLCV